MSHHPANLQIHIYQADGSVVIFVQNDPDEVKRILDEFRPAQIFNQDKIILADRNSITSFPVSKITRIDLVSKPSNQIEFPAWFVDAVELEGAEFQALIHNPVICQQWRRPGAQPTSLVTFLNVEMTDRQRLFFTMETQVEPWSELLITKGLPANGSGFCFRMRTGGVAVLNLANLTRQTFFPGPPSAKAEIWRARQLESLEPARHKANGKIGIPGDGHPPLPAIFPPSLPGNL